MMEEPADERRQLYDRFRSELATSPRDMFFDEKELVEIYDQAGDLDDEHVKLEVLRMASACIPTARIWR